MRIYSVMVVEDEELQLDDICRRVPETHESFRVTARARTGYEALDLFQDSPTSLIITDIRMPQLSGLDLLERVQDLSPDTLGIVVSGHRDFELARQAIEVRALAWLIKPVDTEALRRALFDAHHQLEHRHRHFVDEHQSELGATSPDAVAHAIRRWIRDHYAERISVSLLAEHFHYSPDWISRTFSQNFGSAPSQFIAELRITRAKTLLLQYPDLSIQSVAREVGYPDQAYFSRTFKKQTGLSPAAWREERREDS